MPKTYASSQLARDAGWRAFIAGIRRGSGNHNLPCDRRYRVSEEQGLETVQRIANHESPGTTKLYDCCQDEISLDEVEAISI